MSSINLTLIIGIILIIAGMKLGFDTGLTKGLSHLIALIVTVATLFLILMIRSSIHSGHIKSSIVYIVTLVILGAVYGVVKFILKSAHKVSELPVLHQLDKLAGIAVGILWVAIIYMVMIALAHRGLFGSFGEMVVKDVHESSILTYINTYNIMMPKTR